MESVNVAALRTGFDAVRRGDREAVADMLDPSFEIGERLVPEGRPNVRGPEALLANVAEVREVFGDVTWKPLEIGHLYTFRDGRATRLDIYRSWADARRAAGMGAE